MFRIQQYRPSKRNNYSKVKHSQWSEPTTQQGVQTTIEVIGYRGKIVDEKITEMTVSLGRTGNIEAVWFEVSNPKYSWDNGYFSFMVYYRPRKINWNLSYEEQKAEESEHLLFFVKEALNYFQTEEMDVNVRILDDDLNEIALEEFLSSLATTPAEEPAETDVEENEKEEMIDMNKGYDRDIVLLEKGEFECDGRTFNYDGKTIFVADVVDNDRISFKTVEGHSGSFHITETHHIMMMVHTKSPKPWVYGNTYDEIVYAPAFDEIYDTASEFIESMIGIANHYYDPDKEMRKRVEYSSYKGRLLKDMREMSADELEAIDNEETTEITMSDVRAYIE